MNEFKKPPVFAPEITQTTEGLLKSSHSKIKTHNKTVDINNFLKHYPNSESDTKDIGLNKTIILFICSWFLG